MSKASKRAGFGPLRGAQNRKFVVPAVTAGDDGLVIIWDNTNQTHAYTDTLDTFTFVNPLIDDGDKGITVTSANQTHATPTATIPDIIDAADSFVMNDTSATLTNKTLTTPVIAQIYQDAGKTKLMSLPNTSSDTFAALDATQTLTNKTLTSPKINENVILTATATQLNEAGIKASSACRLYNLGAPVVADVDRIVELTNMKNGAYTVADSPDIPRNITVTHVSGDTTDTLGTITIAGTNYADANITEVIIPVADSTVEGTHAFKTVTSVTGADWAIDESETTNDQIKVGIGNELGLPLALDDADEMIFGILGTTITAHNATVAAPATIEETTIDMSAGTYDGAKAALIFVVD